MDNQNALNTTLTVCIPAFNEAQNIERVLRAVLEQKQEGYELSQIIVYSDASTDYTATAARVVEDERIVVIEGLVRGGKAAALNRMLALAKTDAVVILDADSVIQSVDVLSRLVRCMRERGASLVSGSCKPLPAKSFLQRLLVLGTEVWQELIDSTPNSDLYRCGGQLVLLRKDLYSDITYPKTSADDVFPYIVALERGMQYAYDVHAEIYYKLPATYKDFFRQQTRFLNADASIEHIFGREIARKYYTIGLRKKLRGVIRAVIKHPLKALCYAALLVPPKLVVACRKQDTGGLWAIAESTKDLV